VVFDHPLSFLEAVAATLFEKVFEEAPNTRTMLSVARQKWAMGNPEAALALQEKWAQEHPADLTATLSLAGAYGQQGRAGVRVERYESLYRAGQAMHVDLGLAWSVWKLDLFGGVAFLTSLDQRDDLRLLFFPQYAAQILVWF